MIRLGDLAVFGQAIPGGVFPDAKPLDALRNETGPALVIEQDVVPDPSFAAFLLDDDLAVSGKTLLFPAISSVSGTFLKRGVKFVPGGFALETSADLIMPHAAGMLGGNETPEAAFRTACTLYRNCPVPDETEAAIRMALGLSLGADAPNGEWWIAGGLAGVLQIEPEPELEALLSDPTELLPTLHALASRARQELGLSVQVLDMRQSEVAKSMLTDLAPRDYWNDLATACDALGLAEIAGRYRTAATRIWG